VGWDDSGTAGQKVMDGGASGTSDGRKLRLLTADHYAITIPDCEAHDSSSSSSSSTTLLGILKNMATEGLTQEQLAFFHKNGYLLIPDALSQDTVQQLLGDTNKMLNDFSLDDHPMTKFSTGGDDGADHVGDSYFLESGDKVRFFFEEGTYKILTLLHTQLAMSGLC
jgi:hypothetical protein